MREIVVALSVAVVFTTAALAGPFDDGIEAYKKQDYEKAVQYWFPMALQGDPRAENNIGVLFENGWGIPQDFEKAARWYRRAAEQGHHWAKKNLADLVERGLIDYAYAAPAAAPTEPEPHPATDAARNLDAPFGSPVPLGLSPPRI